MGMTPEEYDLALDALFRRALARLELVSDGRAAVAADARGGSDGKPGDKILHLGRQDWGWEIRSLKNRYGRARKIDDKRRLISEALQTLIHAKFAPDRRFRKGTEEWRLALGKVEGPARSVAFRYGVSIAHLYRCRAEYQKHMASGNGRRAA